MTRRSREPQRAEHSDKKEDELHLFQNMIPFSPIKCCPEKLHEANFCLADQSLKTPTTTTRNYYLRSGHLGGFEELSDDDGTAGKGAGCGWRGAMLGYE